METCDFSRSFVTFIGPKRNNCARIQVESRCVIEDTQTGQSTPYYLVASCKSEDTYGKGCLFREVNYDFCMIYSPTDAMIIRVHGNAERDNREAGPIQGRFDGATFQIVLVDGEALDTNEAVVDATFAGRVVNGCTVIADPAGRYRATIEFPVKTMNVNDIKWMYQVDTGPILFPNFDSDKERWIERFDQAFVAYNKPDEAYFVIQTPTPLVEGQPGKVSHYSRIVRMDAANSVVALR